MTITTTNFFGITVERNVSEATLEQREHEAHLERRRARAELRRKAMRKARNQVRHDTEESVIVELARVIYHELLEATRSRRCSRCASYV